MVKIPIYGEKKVHQQLLEDGVKVSLNTVARYRQELGLKAVLAVKQVNTTIPIKEHKKYTYKIRGLNISHANHVWSTEPPTSRLQVVWSIWPPSLIGTAKLCYHIEDPIPWMFS